NVPSAQPQPMGASTMGVANTMAAVPQSSTPAVTPTPPAGMPRNLPPISSAPPPRVAQPAAAAGVIGASGNGHGPPNEAFAQTMAPSAGNLDMIRDARAQAARGAALPSTTAPDMPAAAAAIEAV